MIHKANKTGDKMCSSFSVLCSESVKILIILFYLPNTYINKTYEAVKSACFGMATIQLPHKSERRTKMKMSCGDFLTAVRAIVNCEDEGASEETIAKIIWQFVRAVTVIGTVKGITISEEVQQ